MARRTVKTEETTFDKDDPEARSLPGGGNGAAAHRPGEDVDPELDPVHEERRKALAAKFQLVGRKAQIELERLETQIKKATDGGDEDELAKLNKEMIASLKTQVQMKNLMKMLHDGDDSHRDQGRSLRDEISEAMRYIDKRLDEVTRGKGGNDMVTMMQLQMQQQAAASDRMLQFMMAMMNRADPNSQMTQQILLKSMDAKASFKDFMPMLSDANKMMISSMSGVQQMQTAAMQEVLAHALEAGDHDWGNMSPMEKAKTVMELIAKGGRSLMAGFKDIRSEVRNFQKDRPHVEGAKPARPMLSNLGKPPAPPAKPQEPPMAETTPPPDTATGEPPVDPPPSALPPEITAPPKDDDVQTIIKARLAQILNVVETEMKVGSDPYAVFDELEKLYLGLPEDLRQKIEATPDPMVLVQSIEGIADKVQLNRIMQMALADQKYGTWLKLFHNAILDLDPDGEPYGDDDDDGDDDDEPEFPQDEDPPTEPEKTEEEPK